MIMANGGYWSPPEHIFSGKTTDATDASNGYSDVFVGQFNQDRIRLWHMRATALSRISRVVFAWHDHNIEPTLTATNAQYTPLLDVDCPYNESVFFNSAGGYLELYPCNRLVVRFYYPTATDSNTASAIIQRWIP